MDVDRFAQSQRLDHLVGAVLGRVEEVVKSIQGADPGTQIKATLTQLQGTITGANRLVGNINLILEENRGDLKSTVGQTHRLTEDSASLLSKRRGEIERSLANLDAAMAHLPAILQNVEELTADLKKNPFLKLSAIQAQAILDMRLQRLTGLERDKILEELAELEKVIAGLKASLESETMLLEVIKKELQEVMDQFGNPRRTEIVGYSGQIRMEDVVPDERRREVLPDRSDARLESLGRPAPRRPRLAPADVAVGVGHLHERNPLALVQRARGPARQREDRLQRQAQGNDFDSGDFHER